MNQKSGEPGGVSDTILNLQPQFQFKFTNNRLRSELGCIGTSRQTQIVYDELLRTAQITLEQSNEPHGFLVTSVKVLCLGQVFTVHFTFFVKNGELILPPNSVAKTILQRKMRHLFN